MKKQFLTLLLLLTCINTLRASYILIPMDKGQTNHLKAYGIAYSILEGDVEIEWLLNYRGGSFMLPYFEVIEKECIYRGVKFEVIADVQAQKIRQDIAYPEVNMERVKLQKPPKIAVYSPSGKQPWDDAVTLVLTYAEIPYDVIYDSAIVSGILPKYDWLHLHHEDFTGQYGKFYAAYRSADWYQRQQKDAEEMANKLGFSKVSQLKLAVATEIKTYVFGGGFLFTMCSGTDSYDIALAAHQADICDYMFDGDPQDLQAQGKLDFENTLAFHNFTLKTNPLEYEFSTIDGTKKHNAVPESQNKFSLFEFSAKWDVIPTMLTQNHTSIVDGFMGQTTDFNKETIKPGVLILGENKSLGTVKYIHSEHGNGTWTFYGGHDPEDFRHYVGDPPTDLNLYPNSAGYRLILNNILFPAAKKKERKT